MRLKIKNELKTTDYNRFLDFLKENPGVSIAVFPGADFEFMSVNPVTVTTEDSGLRIAAEILLEQPIGFEVYENLKLDDYLHGELTVNRRSFQLSKIVTEPADLEEDLTKILKTVESIANHISNRFGKFLEQTFLLNSERLDQQFDAILRGEELEKRGEIPKPFGTIHAASSRDAKERTGGFIPLYKEHDKTYLYDAKQVYFLLPHDFVANLLRCDTTTMVREEEFDRRGKEVLRDLVYKKRLRKHKTLDGTVCYYDLDDKTKRYLVKHLQRKTSRL